jgi:hypothetical protein
VLTRLIQGEGSDRLSEVELLQNCIFILNAGHETTTNLIGNALVCLQEWPAEKADLLSKMERLSEDPRGLEAVLNPAVDEFLRFESSNQLGNRRATRACEVGGVPLESGALVTLGIGAANRDPAQFANPDVLDLSRPDCRHLAFGFGIHQCAGLSLARLEGRIAIGRFLARFPHYQLTASPTRGGRARFRGFLRGTVPRGLNWQRKTRRHAMDAAATGRSAMTPRPTLQDLCRVLPVLPERAQQPHLPPAALCGLTLAPGLPGNAGGHRQPAVPAVRPAVRLRLRVGGALRLREEQARQLQAPAVQLHGRLGDVQGHLDGPHPVLRLLHFL